MAKIIGINGRPVAYLCASKLELNELVDGSRHYSKGESFVLLLDDSPQLAERILPAYINAYIRYNEGGARAASLQMEMLLFVSETMNIGKAIRECGAKNKSRFIVVANNGANFVKFSKDCKVKKLKEYALRLNPDIAPAVSLAGISAES